MECLGHALAAQSIVDIMNSLDAIISPRVLFLTELAATEVLLFITRLLSDQIWCFFICLLYAIMTFN